MTEKQIFVGALIVSATIFVVGLLLFRHTVFVVPASDIALITRNYEIIRQCGPGVCEKAPFFDHVVQINIAREREKRVEVAATLSDGAPCRVVAMIGYKVDAPQLAYQWRFSHNPAALTAEDDSRWSYPEPSRLYEEALTAAMAQISFRQAANGAVERWIYDLHEANVNKVNADGSAFRRIETMSVSCSGVFESKEPIQRPSLFKLQSQ